MNVTSAPLRPVPAPVGPAPLASGPSAPTAPAAPVSAPNRASGSLPVALGCPTGPLGAPSGPLERPGGSDGPGTALRAPEGRRGAGAEPSGGTAPLRFGAPTLAQALGPLGLRHRELSDRERTILALLAQGHTAAAIGRRVGCSTHAAKDRLREAYTALGAANGAHAVALGHLLGDLTAEPLSATVTGPLLGTLELVALGHTNEEIGRLLWLSPDGAKTRVRRLFQELGAVNRPNLVHRGFCCGALGRPGQRREAA